MSRATFRKRLFYTLSGIALLFCLVVILGSPLLPSTKAKPPSTNLTWEVPHLSQTPTIDGRLDEWTSLPSVRLGIAPGQVENFPLWAGPLDCSAIAWLAWNQESLYLAVNVTDSVFHQGHYDFFYIWENDSVQVALDPLLDRSMEAYANDDREFGWALAMSKPVSFCWQGPQAPCEVPEIKAAVAKKSSGCGWTLEAAIPWERIGIYPEAGRRLGFTWMVNDSDKPERDGWIEWTPGIGESKNPFAFGILTLVQATEGIEQEASDESMYQATISYWQRIVATSTDSSQVALAQLWIGHVRTAYGKHLLAAQAYEKVISDYPTDASVSAAVTALSEVYAELGRIRDGITVCESFIKAKAHDPSAVQAGVGQLTELLRRAEGPAAARASLLQLAESYNKEDSLLLVELRLAIAKTYRLEQDLRAASLELRDILPVLPAGAPLRSRIAAELQGVCNELLEVGDADSVLNVFTENAAGSVPLEIMTAEILSLMVNACNQKNDFSRAASYSRELVARFPTHEHAAEARMTFAYEQIEEGKMRAAERTLRDIMRFHPTLDAAGQAVVMLGDLHVEQGNYRQAFRHYQAAASNMNFGAETRAQAAIGAGNIQAFHFRDYDAALKAYQEAQRLSPNGEVGKRAERQIRIISQQ